MTKPAYRVMRNKNARGGMRCTICGGNHGPLYTGTTSSTHEHVLVVDEGGIVQPGARIVGEPSYAAASYAVTLADGSKATATVMDIRGVPTS